MKLKATITRGAPQGVEHAFAHPDFAMRFLGLVVQNVFGVKGSHLRPAEYYVQEPDMIVPVKPGLWGVILTLSGVSRGNREPKIFHAALEKLSRIAITELQANLAGEQAVQLFVNIMLDGDVPMSPPSATYSSMVEGKGVWVTSRGVQDDIPEWLKQEPASDDSVAPVLDPEAAHAGG